MAVGLLIRFPGIGTDKYDAVMEELELPLGDAGDGWPEGIVSHVAGSTPDGALTVVDVWESQEHLDRFLSERLMPVVDKLMAANPDAPPPARQESYELHNVMTGVRSGVS